MKTGYNSFIVVDCKKRKTVMVTNSARKTWPLLQKGFRVEVWNSGCIVEKIYSNEKQFLYTYVSMEKEYIGQKQRNHEERNKKRKMMKGETTC